MTPEKVIDFWFTKHGEKDWFAKSAAFDAAIRKLFLPTYRAIVAGETHDWRVDPLGRLAEVIVLDQFARNIFRGAAESFAQDPLALALAQEAVRLNADKVLSKRERRFFYMPYMHSESKKIQKLSIDLFRALGDKEILGYALAHKKIIDRFGRFPHRNDILGRRSTPEEKKLLKTHPGF